MDAAGKTLQQGFCDEATCSICLDYVKDPVIIPEYGHNFCKTCLDQYWKKSSSSISCPHCRILVQRRMVTSNRPLENLTDMAKKFSLSGEKRAIDEEGICDKHSEPQKLFCQKEEVHCVVCDRSKEHRSLQVISMEEIFEKHKDQFMNCLTILREKKEKAMSCKSNTEKEIQGLLNQVKTETEKTVRAFRELHQVLEEQEKLLLAQMEEVMEEIERERENHLDRLEKERQSLERIIQEMEEKLNHQAVDLLKDIGNFMKRCEEGKNCENSPITFPTALNWRIYDFGDINHFLEGITKQFKDSLLSGLQLHERKFWGPVKANVHFDPETAHPNLIVSEDCKSVRWTETPQDVRDNHKNTYDSWTPFVLGWEEFTAGRHFWEVALGSEETWAVGVTTTHVRRPKGVSWGLEKFTEGYQCLMNVGNVSLNEAKWGKIYWNRGDYIFVFKPLNEEPKKIRVVLNCEGGRVTFYDADRGTMICEFSEAPFARETLRPIYRLEGNAQLTLSS